MKINTVDILENEIIKQYPDVLDILLRDNTTQKNILWATHNYEHLGDNCHSQSQISPELITGKNGNVIMPRVEKSELLKKSRSKVMAEVFTPSWVCNSQNNLIDDAWFEKKNVFNREIEESEGLKWIVNKSKIKFPKNKTWENYIADTRLEMACGEAPYIISRYDTTDGQFIPIENRIGILDRKFRVINENIDTSGAWLKAAQNAYKNTYAFEYQGDSLLIARESMLATFIENYRLKFNKEPQLQSIQCIARIISWNIWQMDGLKGVIPNSCGRKNETTVKFFGETETKHTFCEGCEKGNIKKHNGVYCLVKDWSNKDLKTGKTGRKIRFIDLLNNREK